MFRDLITKGLENVSVQLLQGNINPDTGLLSPSTLHLSTGFINGGNWFIIHLKPGFRILNCHWYHASSHDPAQLDADAIAIVPGYNRGRMYSFLLPHQFDCRLVIVRDNYDGPLNSNGYYDAPQPQGSISPLDEPLLFFYRLIPQHFRRLSSAFPWHNQARQQLSRLNNCIYSYRRARAGTSASWNRKGMLWLGPPYSNSHWQCADVGNNISLYTFLTATQNKRSLFYTERPKNRISAYGIQYPSSKTDGLNDNNMAFFGCVCHSIPNFALNTDKIFTESDFGSDNVFGLTKLTIQSIDDCRNILPFDFAVKNNSHIYFVIDVWQDALGNTRFIEIAESGAYNSHSRFSLQTPEHFYQRFSDYGMTGLYRPGNASSLQFFNNKPIEDTPFIQLSPTDHHTPILYNEDICTFAGDKASFLVGNKVFVNVNRANSKWNAMRLLRRIDNPAIIYRDDFEGYTSAIPENGKTMLLPQGWRRIHDYVTISDEYAPMLFYNPDQASSQPYSLILNKSCMTVMPSTGIQVSKLQMNLHLSTNSSATNRTLLVGVLSDPDDYRTFTTVASFAYSSLPADGLVSVDFSSYQGTGTHIAFQNVKGNDDYSIFYIDDIELRLRQGQTDPDAPAAYQCVALIDISSSAYPQSSDDDPDTDDREDWVDVDLSPRFSSKSDAGLYRATAYNSNTAAESRPTDFEMLWLSLLKFERFGSLNGAHIQVDTAAVSSLRITREKKDGTAYAHDDLLWLPDQALTGIAVWYPYSCYSTQLGLYARGIFGNDVHLQSEATVKTQFLPSSYPNAGKAIQPDGSLATATGFSTTDRIQVTPSSIYRLAFVKKTGNSAPLRANLFTSDSASEQPISTLTVCDASDLPNGTYFYCFITTGPDTNYLQISVATADDAKSLAYIGPNDATEAINNNHEVEI